MTMTVKEAAALARRAHMDQVDRDGEPHIEHVKRVYDLVRARFAMHDESRMRVALLHDVIEDTPTTLEDLVRAGLPPVEAAAVVLLSRPTEEQSAERGRKRPTYREYVSLIISSSKVTEAGKIALDVKECDALDNISRCLDASDLMVARYAMALEMIWKSRA